MDNDSLRYDRVLTLSEESTCVALVQEACESDEFLEFLLESLSDARRKLRQNSARILRDLALQLPQRLQGKEDVLIDALYRPEAQTRWEILTVLSQFCIQDEELLEQAQEAALDALYDEDSGLVRLAAFKYLLKLSQESAERLEILWPSLEEALQCYHGDNAYRDMLGELRGFATQALPDHLKDALIKRLSFDAEQGRGYLKTMSLALIEQLSSK